MILEPKIWSLQAEPKVAAGVSSSPRAGEDQCLRSTVRQAAGPFTQPFCLIQVFN